MYTFLLYYLQVKHPLRDWRQLGRCQKVIQHSPNCNYDDIAVNTEGLLALADNACVRLLTKEGSLVRSIDGRVLGDGFGYWPGIALI